VNTLETGSGRTRIRLVWQYRGRDLHVHISGGADHVGAVALAGSGPDGAALAGVLWLPPHREDELALATARRLHAAGGVTVCVTAGIHVEALTPKELARVLENVERAVAALARRLEGDPASGDA